MQMIEIAQLLLFSYIKVKNGSSIKKVRGLEVLEKDVLANNF